MESQAHGRTGGINRDKPSGSRVAVVHVQDILAKGSWDVGMLIHPNVPAGKAEHHRARGELYDVELPRYCHQRMKCLSNDARSLL